MILMPTNEKRMGVNAHAPGESLLKQASRLKSASANKPWA